MRKHNTENRQSEESTDKRITDEIFELAVFRSRPMIQNRISRHFFANIYRGMFQWYEYERSKFTTED